MYSALIIIDILTWNKKKAFEWLYLYIYQSFLNYPIQYWWRTDFLSSV